MPGYLASYPRTPEAAKQLELPPLIELLGFAQSLLPTLRPHPKRIWKRFALTELQYHAALVRAIDDPAAWAMAPELMQRLQERRDKARARRRIGGNP
jgi:hypothetical protein